MPAVRHAKRARTQPKLTVLSDNIAKPREDKKLYRLIQLPNQLRALLISDPSIVEQNGDSSDGSSDDGGEEAEEVAEEEGEEEEESGEEGDGDDDSTQGRKAACALSVGVGSLCDPPGLDGLAHYVEHMVFMGTKRFPTENEWSSFLAERGGEDNGETDWECTSFYFDVQPEHLRDSLERFASFFECPLFSMGSAEREVQAIESEFQQARVEDDNRHHQLLCHLCPDGHPYHRFSWGDQRSLVERPAADQRDMSKALREFHKKYYGAQLMTLVVLGREPLGVLQDWVVDSFGRVPPSSLERPSFSSHPPPFSPAAGSTPLTIHQTTLKDKPRLQLTWYVPSLLSRHKTRPEQYVEFLLGHEAHGSCLQSLKEEGLAMGLCAGVDDSDHTSLAANFNVEVELTPAGDAQVDRVIELVLAALGHLAREPPQEWVWREMRDVARMRFEFAESEPELEYARRLSISLQRRFDPDKTLSAEVLLDEFSPEDIGELLARLVPAGLIVTLQRKQPSDATSGAAGAAPVPSVEPWFGTGYLTEPVAKERLDRWERAYAGDGTPPAAGPFTIPPPNEFIPTDFAIAHAQQHVQVGQQPVAHPPSLILSSSSGLLFHVPDTRFGTPKAIVCAQIETASTVATSSALGRVLDEVTAWVALERINAESYAATLAGSSYELTANERGWSLEVHGFSHKLGKLLRRVLAELHALACSPCDEPTLSRVLTRYRVRLQNANFDPSALCTSERLRCLEAHRTTPEDRLAVLDSVTPSALTARLDHVLRSQGVRLVAYAGGNLARAEACALFDDALEALGQPKRLATLPPLPRCASLPAGESMHTAMGKNPQDVNAAVDLFWQIGVDGVNSAAVSARLNLLEHIMFEPLFDTLRTKQQLGYSVSCSARNTHGVLGFLISVVTATHTADGVHSSCMAFVRGFLCDLRAMKPSEYAAHVRSAAANRLLADKTIEDEASRFWHEIDMRTYRFDLAEAEAAAMRECPQEELVGWIEENLLADTTPRLTVVVQPPNKAPLASKSEGGRAVNLVGDPRSFSASLSPAARQEGTLPQLAKH
jgi:secreted Zn-dependent insulinase-like peptidase